ncbi:hypothetical protein HK096_001278, partial [Nowakowskiella sp. JEL0078]
TKRRQQQGWSQPGAETRRVQYRGAGPGPGGALNAGAVGLSRKCAHCCKFPRQTFTSQGMFCSVPCEQRESTMMGAGVLIATADKKIVILGLMKEGAYKDLYSFFFDEKRPQELAREACRRIVNEQIAGRIQITDVQSYTLAKHSAPNVFSYVVTYNVTGQELQTLLPPNDPQIVVAHFFSDAFMGVRLESDGKKGMVKDVFQRLVPVSRMTLQVVSQMLSS